MKPYKQPPQSAVFVCTLFGAILLTNTVPAWARFQWPAKQPIALTIISEISLGIFLTVAEMSLQLWDDR